MTSTAPSRPLKVMLACSGLDHAHRGFESFARDCFGALRDDPRLELQLVKGSGRRGDRERVARTLTRDTRLAKVLGRMSGREPFRFEQFAFAFSLQPLLLRERPDVVYFSEWHTGLGLALARHITRQRFATVLSNGTMAVTRFAHLTRVQELTPAGLETVLELGANPRRHTMLPLGFDLRPEFEPPSDAERAALRERAGLPADRHVVICVAALNNHHKRLRYLVEEVARIPPGTRPYLLMAGQREEETAGIEALAHERLGENGFDMRTVPQEEVDGLLRASDTFVLASLGEGLPRALIEGLSRGLPCVTHDYPVSRYALERHGIYGDFTKPGGLADLLVERAAQPRSPERAAERHRYAYEKFSWDRLRERYVELLFDAAQAASV